MKKSTVFLVFTLLITFVHGQENYSQWTKNKLITLNTTASGANVTGALTKFPLAVQLTASDSDVFKQALPGGADIRFTDSAGTTRYKHQKESWDSAGRTATFWVLLPTVTGNANNYLRIRWGKTGVADSSSGAAVFDTANRFNGVWHMNAGTGNETDATINANVLTPSTSSPTNGVGAVGPGRVFSGTNQYFVASNPSTVTGALDIRPGTPHTVSAWVFGSVIPTASNSGVSIVNKGDHQWNLSVYANKWETSTGISATGWAYVASTNAPTANAWHLIVGTWAGGITGNVQSQLYVDGVLNSTSNQASGNTPKTTYNVFVGANPDAGNTPVAAPGSPTVTPTNEPRFWNGTLDEIVVSSTLRSADWIKLSYETQKKNGAAVTVGPTGNTVSLLHVPNKDGSRFRNNDMFNVNGRRMDLRMKGLPINTTVLIRRN